jgi:hypothetical protein
VAKWRLARSVRGSITSANSSAPPGSSLSKSRAKRSRLPLPSRWWSTRELRKSRAGGKPSVQEGSSRRNPRSSARSLWGASTSAAVLSISGEPSNPRILASGNSRRTAALNHPAPVPISTPKNGSSRSLVDAVCTFVHVRSPPYPWRPTYIRRPTAPLPTAEGEDRLKVHACSFYHLPNRYM